MSDVLLTRRSKMVRFTCHDVPARPGMAGKIFTALGAAKINVIHMFNAEHGENEGDISFSVGENSFEKAREVIDGIHDDIGTADVTIEHDIAILSFDLEETVCETVLGTMTVALNVLSRQSIDVRHIAGSRNRIFLVLPDAQADRASNILSRALKEDPIIHPI